MISFELSPPSLEKFDLGGVLYHANYFHLYEQARERFLAEIAKLPYPELVKKGHHLAIVETEVKFRSPVFYGDRLKISLSCSSLRKSSLILNYSIHNSETSLLLNDSKTKLAFVTQLDGKFRPDKMPKQLQEAFRSIETNS
jgi:acyl-CoA thioester hydrolase